MATANPNNGTANPNEHFIVKNALHSVQRSAQHTCDVRRAACSLNSVQHATCAARSRAQCVTRHGGARACVGRRKSAATLLSAYADALGRHSVLPPARTQYTLEYSRVPDASQSTKRHRPVARVAFALGCANCERASERGRMRVC